MTSFTSLETGHDCLDIDLARKQAAAGSRRLGLTRKESELLMVLVQNAGVLLPRNVLLRLVWGYGPEIVTRTLDVHIRRLRKKMGSQGECHIETVFGIGYRFQPFPEPNRFQPQAYFNATEVAA